MRTTGGAGSTGGTAPAHQTTVRRMNLALLLKNLLADGPRSRARLAEDTGLTKATVSSLVAELGERRLVSEGGIDRGNIGRPGRMVQIDTSVVRCMGLEINVDYVVAVITDLTGRVRYRRRLSVPLRDLGPARGLGEVADFARSSVQESGCAPEQVETLHVSVPGLIDVEAGVLSYAPNLHWRQVDVVHSLLGRLQWHHARVSVDNDANLGAMAEYTTGRSAGTRNLLYLVGDAGVGAGLMVDGRIVRGRMGFAGEVGHMPVGRPEKLCGCGRRGCWESAVGLAAVVDGVPGTAHAPGDLGSRLDKVERLAAAGDPQTLAVLTEVGVWLGRGAALLANVLDPEVIILGGHFAALQRYLGPAVRTEMRERVVAEPQTVRVEFSEFGSEAPALGAAHAGIDLLVGDPTLVAAR
ncbi:ROK family protein [Nakamurella alba]|nr:ROK family protein [Nakamurella alba]